MIVRLKIADIPFEIDLNHKDVMRVIGSFCTDDTPLFRLRVEPEEIETYKRSGTFVNGQTDADAEYSLLYPKISDKMLEYNRVGFHGTAFMWNGKAWIFTAASGTGKSTQYVLWKSLFSDEVSIINGDKPFLDFSDDKIMVHTSPWAGKEQIWQMQKAELGGIIILEKSSVNCVEHVEPRKAAGMMYLQFMFSRTSVADVLKVCSLEERLLMNTPLWKLSNKGDAESAVLCHNTIVEGK